MCDAVEVDGEIVGWKLSVTVKFAARQGFLTKCSEALLERSTGRPYLPLEGVLRGKKWRSEKNKKRKK